MSIMVIWISLWGHFHSYQGLCKQNYIDYAVTNANGVILKFTYRCFLYLKPQILRDNYMNILKYETVSTCVSFITKASSQFHLSRNNHLSRTCQLQFMHHNKLNVPIITIDFMTKQFVQLVVNVRCPGVDCSGLPTVNSSYDKHWNSDPMQSSDTHL